MLYESYFDNNVTKQSQVLAYTVWELNHMHKGSPFHPGDLKVKSMVSFHKDLTDFIGG